MREVIKYISADGWTFDTKQSCIEHEALVKSKAEADKVFSEKFHKFDDIDPIIIKAVSECIEEVEDVQNVEAYWFEAYDGWKDTLKNKYAGIHCNGVYMEYASTNDLKDLNNGSIYVFLRSWSGDITCVFSPGLLLGKFTGACYKLGETLTKEIEKVLGR